MSNIERDDDLCPHGWPPEFCGNCHEEEADDTRLCAHHRCEVCGPALNSQLRGAVDALYGAARSLELAAMNIVNREANRAALDAAKRARDLAGRQ